MVEQLRQFEITMLETCPDCTRPLFQDIVHICHGERRSSTSRTALPAKNPPLPKQARGFPFPGAKLASSHCQIFAGSY